MGNFFETGLHLGPQLGDPGVVASQRMFQPMSLGLTVVMTIAGGAAFVGIGLASIFARLSTFGLGIGLVLVGYGAVILAIAWCLHRRYGFAWGLAVAVALLNAFVAGSLITGGDGLQRVVASVVLGIAVVNIVVGILPATRNALLGESRK